MSVFVANVVGCGVARILGVAVGRSGSCVLALFDGKAYCIGGAVGTSADSIGAVAVGVAVEFAIVVYVGVDV